MLLGPREEHLETIFQSPCWKESSTGNKITSWKSLVKQSRNKDEANVTLERIDGELHVQICSPIAAGTELLYWLTQTQADAAYLEENSPGSKSDGVAVAEKANLQVTSVIEEDVLVKQRGPLLDGSTEACFKDPADVPKIMEPDAKSTHARRRSTSGTRIVLFDLMKDFWVEREKGSEFESS